MVSYDEPRSRTGLLLLGLALGLGVLGDGLLRATPWGANLGLWCLALALAALVGSRWHARQRASGASGGGSAMEAPGAARWGLALAAVACAGVLAWRASPTLAGLNVLAAALLAATAAAGPSLRRAGLASWLKAWAGSAGAACAGVLVLVLGDVQWARLPREGTWGRAVALGRGLAIATPLLLVFGSLLASADDAYRALLVRCFSWRLEDLVGHLALCGLLTWATAGYLRRACLETPAGSEGSERRWLGVLEASLVLGLLDALFASFVVVQFRYFFGGTSLVEATKGLTYADYARHGFFELVTVVALALPLLLALHALSKPQTRWFTGLAAGMVALLGVIAASAMLRMLLYTQVYGLTELRLYTSVFMAWLAIALAWFVPTVLAGRPERFMAGAFASAMLVLAGLDAANPDPLIARTNLAHGHAVDLGYLAGLSDDAVPVVLQGLGHLPAPARAEAASSLLATHDPHGAPDWRTWNLARATARAAVLAREAELRRWAAELPKPPVAVTR